MRIIGYLDTKGYKTTVFKNNDKFIVKFESEFFEQVFKFKESSQIKNLNDIRNLIDLDFLNGIEVRFKEMYESSDTLFSRFFDDQKDDWIEIV
ncbi:MAG: hypothetical protein MK207_01040 [Saprospiraceae bacterium]|nr:hypothetical protein [Saprospiraceae bacterium]